MDFGVIPRTAVAVGTPEEKHMAGSKALEHGLLMSGGGGGSWFLSRTPVSSPGGGMLVSLVLFPHLRLVTGSWLIELKPK